MKSKGSAFTLIELLIVVAIIAILAAIAVPNFLEAQTRAKISRTKADLRTIAVGVESYRVDTNHYPPPFGVLVHGNDSWAVLSTPVAYLTASRTTDVFAAPGGTVGQTTMTYEDVNDQKQLLESPPTVPYSVDPADQPVAWWWVASRGPDKKYGFQSPATDPEASIRQKFAEADANPGNWLSVIYDPTNGTLSLGNIYRAGGDLQGYAAQTMNGN